MLKEVYIGFSLCLGGNLNMSRQLSHPELNRLIDIVNEWWQQKENHEQYRQTGVGFNFAEQLNKIFPDTMLEGLDLRRLKLRGANLAGFRLCNVNLEGADLAKADLKNVYLYGANLNEANLSGANLTGSCNPYCHIKGADFSGVDLRFSGWEKGNYGNEDATETNFTGANLSGLHYDNGFKQINFANSILANTVLIDADIRELRPFFIARGAICDREQLQGFIRDGKDLSGINLNGLDLKAIDLTRAKLKNAQLIGATSIILSGKTISGEELRQHLIEINAEIDGAIFEDKQHILNNFIQARLSAIVEPTVLPTSLASNLTNPLIFSQADNASKKTLAHMPILTDPHSGMQFSQHAILGDGDCGYTALNITRADAYQLLSNNLKGVRILLQPAIREALLTESFMQYLKNNEDATGGLLAAFRQYQQVARDASNTDAAIEQLYRYGDDLAILQAYLAYDIRDKQIDGGWSHPVILQALAHSQNMELYIWQPGIERKVIPHTYYSHYRSMEADGRIDLLFVNGNHFERLERLNPTAIQQILPENEGIHEASNTSSQRKREQFLATPQRSDKLDQTLSQLNETKTQLEQVELQLAKERESRQQAQAQINKLMVELKNLKQKLVEKTTHNPSTNLAETSVEQQEQNDEAMQQLHQRLTMFR